MSANSCAGDDEKCKFIEPGKPHSSERLLSFMVFYQVTVHVKLARLIVDTRLRCFSQVMLTNWEDEASNCTDHRYGD